MMQQLANGGPLGKSRFICYVLPLVLFALLFYTLYFTPSFKQDPYIENKAVAPCPTPVPIERPSPVTVTATNCYPNICTTKRDAVQAGPVQDGFEKIYSNFLWGGEGGGSGLGSEPSYTITTRMIMELVIYKFQVTSLMDAPCGAIKWTRILLSKVFEKIPCFKYWGLDVVRSVITNLTDEFKPIKNMAFAVADLSVLGIQLPPGDLILCRDALQHLPYANIINILENYSKSKARYLIVGSYPGGSNGNITIGSYFAIDLKKTPFNLNETVEEFNENTPDKKWLYLYKIEYLKTLDFAAIRARAGV